MEVANIRKVLELSSPALLLYVTKHVFIQQEYIIFQNFTIYVQAGRMIN